MAHGYPFLLYQDLHFYTKRKFCIRKIIKLINHTYKISKHFAEVDFVQICIELIIKLISQMINKLLGFHLKAYTGCLQISKLSGEIILDLYPLSHFFWLLHNVWQAIWAITKWNLDKHITFNLWKNRDPKAVLEFIPRTNLDINTFSSIKKNKAFPKEKWG